MIVSSRSETWLIPSTEWLGFPLNKCGAMAATSLMLFSSNKLRRSFSWQFLYVIFKFKHHQATGVPLLAGVFKNWIGCGLLFDINYGNAALERGSWSGTQFPESVTVQGGWFSGKGLQQGELLHLLLCLVKEDAAFVPAALHKGSISGLFGTWKQDWEEVVFAAGMVELILTQRLLA